MLEPPGTWEPVGEADLKALSELIATATVLEHAPHEVLTGRPPGAPVGEIVVWAWTFSPDRRHVLLVDHPRFGCWLPPAGRVRPGEHPHDAVARELFEETGLVGRLVSPAPALADVVTSRSPSGELAPTFGLAFVVEASPEEPLVPEPAQPAAWWPVDSPPERCDERHWARIMRGTRPPPP